MAKTRNIFIFFALCCLLVLVKYNIEKVKQKIKPYQESKDDTEEISSSMPSELLANVKDNNFDNGATSETNDEPPEEIPSSTPSDLDNGATLETKDGPPEDEKTAEENLDSERKTEEEKGLKGNKNKIIFFIESSGNGTLENRHACSIESAALHHPKSKVLIYTTREEGLDMNNKYVQLVMQFSNVVQEFNNLEKATKDTALEKWIEKSGFRNGKYFIEHSSDIIRHCMLWKHGGIYMDMDVIALRNLQELNNCAAMDVKAEVASAVLILEAGNLINKLFIERIPGSWKSGLYVSIGPKLLTNVFKDVCGTNNIMDSTREQCQGYRLEPNKTFYLVPWFGWWWLFNKQKSDKLRVQLQTNKAYAVHLFNKLAKTHRLEFGTGALLEDLAKENCPKTFEETKKQGYF